MLLGEVSPRSGTSQPFSHIIRFGLHVCCIHCYVWNLRKPQSVSLQYFSRANLNAKHGKSKSNADNCNALSPLGSPYKKEKPESHTSFSHNLIPVRNTSQKKRNFLSENKSHPIFSPNNRISSMETPVKQRRKIHSPEEKNVLSDQRKKADA
jgi:hypothetical protein